MTSAGFIDATSHFGPDHGPDAGAPLSALLAEQRSHGIRLTLAHSLVAIRNPTLGNRAALDAGADAANHVAAVVVAAPTASAGEPEAAVAAAAKSGAVAFWMGGASSPAIRSYAVERVLKAVARTGLPLFAPLGPKPELGAATAIGAATAGLGIPVILVGAHYTNIVDTLAACEWHDHLSIETSSMAHFDAIERAVARIGHERILFGTGGPDRPHQAPLSLVLHARIPDDAKRAILAGNAERLFDLPTAPVDLTPDPLPARAYDVHTHFHLGNLDLDDIPDRDLAGRLAPYGTRALVSSSLAAITSDLDLGNRLTVEASAASGPQGGLLVVDPTDLPAARDHLRRWGDAPGIRGTKIHAQWSGVWTEDPRMTALFSLLAAYGKPVKIHNDGPLWESALLALATRHPELPIIVAHAGLGYPMAEGGRLAASTDNVLVEFVSSFASLRQLREAARLAGSSRILYGTDAPIVDPRFVIGSYRDAGIPQDRFDDVFWGNAVRLFGEPT